MYHSCPSQPPTCVAGSDTWYCSDEIGLCSVRMVLQKDVYRWVLDCHTHTHTHTHEWLLRKYGMTVYVVMVH